VASYGPEGRVVIRIATGALCTLLTDLVPLAAPEDGGGALAGVLLHTDRGHPYPSEPGKSDLLIGTAASKFGAGHAFTESEGQMSSPMLWPTSWVTAVVQVFKPMTKANKDHQVQITRDGDHVTVQEDPNLFDDGMRLEFKTGDLDHYPRSIWRLLNDRPPTLRSDKREEKPRLDISPGVLLPFLKIAQRRGTTINLFKYHQERLVLLEIGARFRGYLVPSRYETDKTSVGQAAHEPDGEIFFPDLPPIADDKDAALWTPWRDTGVKIVKTGTPDPVLPLGADDGGEFFVDPAEVEQAETTS
jgi:S-DNA-T family DNA segregation ATPase FtsK/SpoIIIE